MDEEANLSFLLEENRLRANLAFSKRCIDAAESPLLKDQWRRFLAMDEAALASHLTLRTKQTELPQ